MTQWTLLPQPHPISPQPQHHRTTTCSPSLSRQNQQFVLIFFGYHISFRHTQINQYMLVIYPQYIPRFRWWLTQLNQASFSIEARQRRHGTTLWRTGSQAAGLLPGLPVGCRSYFLNKIWWWWFFTYFLPQSTYYCWFSIHAKCPSQVLLVVDPFHFKLSLDYEPSLYAWNPSHAQSFVVDSSLYVHVYIYIANGDSTGIQC